MTRTSTNANNNNNNNSNVSSSLFPLFCVLGHYVSVSKILQKTSREDLKSILEKRFTSMRLSPLAFTIATGKNIQLGIKPMEHVKVVKLLLQYGAQPHVTDVVGKTVCHYGAGCVAIDWTLEAVEVCIEAAKSAHLFGKQVEIVNVENSSWNGKRGVVGGYLAEGKKRIIQITKTEEEGGDREVAVAPTKLRLVMEEDLLSIKPLPPLIDIQDRMGSVCMHEIIMSQREDVAKLLLTKYNASIDIDDADGFSPRSMVMNNYGMLASSVSPIIMKMAMARGRQEKKKKGVKCDKCQTLEPHPGAFQKCSRCKFVVYCGKPCQKTAWKEWHKDDCTIVLDKPPAVGLATIVSMKTGKKNTEDRSGGGYRKPDGVAVGEEFCIKVQAAGSIQPLMVYDQSRQCSFRIFPGEKGFDRIFKKVLEEKATQGRKSYFKAIFDVNGNCNIYPNSTTLKVW